MDVITHKKNDRRENDSNIDLIIDQVQHQQRLIEGLADVVNDLNAMVLARAKLENQLDPEKFSAFVMEARNFKDATERIGRVEAIMDRMEKSLNKHILIMSGDGLEVEGVVDKVRALSKTEGRRNWFIGGLWVAFVGWLAKHWN